MAVIFSALSNPNRLKIYMRLLVCCQPGKVCDTTAVEISNRAGEIGRGLGIAPSTVSHHLKELRQANLIETRRDGQRIECSVNTEVLRALSGFFSDESVTVDT